MQDLSKSSQISKICEDILKTVDSYENDANKIYFDYESVINNLEFVQTVIKLSARCPRPFDLPSNLIWDEELYNSNESFDPIVYRGTMSPENYEKVCDAYFENGQEESDDFEL